MSREAAKPPREEALREPDERSEILASMVLDAALEVHRNLGPAFLESVYENTRATRQLRRAPPEDGMPASRPDPLTLPLPSLGGFAAWRLSSSSLAHRALRRRQRAGPSANDRNLCGEVLGDVNQGKRTLSP